MIRGIHILFLLSNLLFSETKVFASDGESGDNFGKSVSISNNWFAVGANKDDDNGENSGSVYLYRYDDFGILEEYKIIPSDGDYNEYFGKTLSISQEWLIVSSIYDDVNGEKSGSVYVFQYNGSSWIEFVKIYPEDGDSYDRFGYSLDLHENKMIIGAVYDDDYGENSGSAYVYFFDGSNWILEQKINSNFQQEEAHFGRSVSIYDNIIAVGAYAEDNIFENTGSVTVFYYDGLTWIEIQKIFASDANAYDYFGSDIDIFDDKLVIGSYYADNIYDNSGSVYVYKLSNNIFELNFKINAYDEYLNDNFGQSVSIYNNYIAVGSMNDDNGTNSGAVYVYEIANGAISSQAKFYPEDSQQYDEFSSAISLYGDKLIAGSLLDDDIGNDAGSAYIYNYSGCSDEFSCNYSDGVVSNNDLCIYPVNGFNCDDSCLYDIDECGVCGGIGPNGDVDFNGTLNIADIIIILDFMLGGEVVNMCTANVNLDALVNVTDIIVIINNILNI